MPKFRKKPVVIEAFLFGEEWPEWFAMAVGDGKVTIYGTQERPGHKPCAEISTLEGDMMVSHGDWIIQGVKGELYPCKPDIFAATYEAV
jgi:hypothetical protein